MRRLSTLLCGLAFWACSPAAPDPNRPTPPPPTPVERAGRPPGGMHGSPTLSGRAIFQRFFRARTLRIDVAHRGNHKRESYRVVALVREGVWAGSRTKLSDPFNYGAHRFEIHDVATGVLLYSRSFSSLFGEWQSTTEAKKTTRTFSESVRIPLPFKPFHLSLYSRQKTGKLKRVFKTRLDPASPRVKNWGPPPPVVFSEVLHRSGPLQHKLDVLIIGDGYTVAEKDKFLRDAKRFSQVMTTDSTFGKLADKMNIRALLVPSKVSGVSEPRKGLNKKTPLGLSFNTFNSPRYLMTTHNTALRNIAANEPYDALYLMANTARYGGGGIFNLYSTFPSDNEYDEYVFIHEFGHSFGGLGDEYYDSSVAYSEFYPKGVEPWEPNITAFLNGRVKWRSLVAAGTPIPTPNRPQPGNVVGLFEGAGYSAKGLYRSQWNCKMRGKGHAPFCKVCRAALAAMIQLYAD